MNGDDMRRNLQTNKGTATMLPKIIVIMIIEAKTQLDDSQTLLSIDAFQAMIELEEFIYSLK